MSATTITATATSDRTPAGTGTATSGSAARTSTRPSAAQLRGWMLGVYRIVVSGLFVMHGLQGFGLFGGVDGKGTAVPLLSWPAGAATLIETIAGALILLGVFARPAAVLCSGTMAFAYFTVHAPIALLPLANMGEPAALYSWTFLLLAIFGPGSFALGTVLRRSRSAQRQGDAV